MNIQNLKNKIIEASQEYYTGDPIISDDEFDGLLEQLRQLSPDDDLLKTVSTGYVPNKDSGTKVRHLYQRVGSLNKINATTCEKYFAKKETKEYCITSKIDGGSIVIYYDAKGRFEKAVTRGDGEIGIDCSSKISWIVPLMINICNIAVRGEIIMTKDIFNEFYSDKASPRNMAIGILSRDDVSSEEIKRLSFVAYDIYGDIGSNQTRTKSEIMDWLAESRFTAATYTKFMPENLELLKGKLNPEFPADGLVITNENDPTDSIAYKFIAETAETTITGIEWEISRLGYLIPVIHFNPVKLSGATLTKCSGFNARWIMENDVVTETKIIVQRSGEVIPYIKKVISGYPLSYDLPKICPNCQEKLEWKGVHLFCHNDKCPGKIKHKFFKWYETLAQIDNLGENILNPFFMTIKWVEVSDIYASTYEEWKETISYGFETPHAQKLLWQLYDKLYKEPVDPDLFTAAFGLPAVGEGTSKRISQEIGLEKYFSGKPSTNKTLDLPSQTAEVEDIIRWLQNLSRITEPAIDSLLQNFDAMKKIYEQIVSRQGFIKKIVQETSIKVAITGKLSKPRKELVEEFTARGIEVTESLSKDVSFLITDDPASGSSKNVKAQKLEIKVVSESDFRKEMNL